MTLAFAIVGGVGVGAGCTDGRGTVVVPDQTPEEPEQPEQPGLPPKPQLSESGHAAAGIIGDAENSFPSPGLRLIVPLNSRETWLVDTNGTIVHTWTSDYFAGHAAYLLDDGSLLRAIKTGMSALGQIAGGGVQRIAFDGTVVWDFRYDSGGVVQHHDLEVLPNGNVMMIAWEEMTRAEAEAAGRHPLLLDDFGFRPDHIVEVRPTGPTSGDIVWQWHAIDHVIQDVDATKANFGDVAAHPELIDLNHPIVVPIGGDWNHVNAIFHDPVHDWIMLSSRGQNEIWIIDHSTTTAEAAGHTGGRWGKGGDLLYRWGNPLAHRAGEPADQVLFGQHSAHIIPPGFDGAGNVLLFNNEHPGGSAVWEIELPLDANDQFVLRPDGRYGPDGPIWSYAAPELESFILSNVTRLPNGNTLVCSGVQRWIFEVNKGGDIVWEFQAPASTVFQSHYVERSMWADCETLSRSAGGRVVFDIVAGSERAGHLFFILGSLSGQTPGTGLGGGVWLPLNLDAYFFGTVSGGALMTPAAGVLDALGRAQSAFSAPAGLFDVALEGLRFDHTFVAFDPETEGLSKVGTPVGFTIVR